ncbi:SGNH hydrolase domain-containing protein [Nocardioides litoris]|uniref:SGNH hydrolase domain-containing protein n=1 Tax=Nocardioides litoris TaxID=1926648 RepID=UPI00111CF1B3|nr:SGNH hydrolase domain-containing protein [Nocardioides litoris]
MTKRSPLPAVVGLLLLALIAGLLASAPTASAADPGSRLPVAAKVKPGQDFPTLPPRCASRKDKIPPEPVVCQLNGFDAAKPTVLLWGDSHSWMFIPALKKAIAGRGVNLVAVMMGSCPPMDNQTTPTSKVPACYRSNALGIDAARRLQASGRPYRIVLVSSWQRYVHALQVRDTTSYVGTMALAMREGTPRLVRTLRSIGSPVDVVGQVATVPVKHRRCAKGNLPFACRLPRKASLPGEGVTRRYVQRTFAPLLGSRAAINVNRTICNARWCQGKIGSIRTWFDDLHLSATRSATMSSYFAGTVEAVAPARRTTSTDPTASPTEEPGGSCFPLLPC